MIVFLALLITTMSKTVAIVKSSSSYPFSTQIQAGIATGLLERSLLSSTPITTTVHLASDPLPSSDVFISIGPVALQTSTPVISVSFSIDEHEGNSTSIKMAESLTASVSLFDSFLSSQATTLLIFDESAESQALYEVNITAVEKKVVKQWSDYQDAVKGDYGAIYPVIFHLMDSGRAVTWGEFAAWTMENVNVPVIAFSKELCEGGFLGGFGVDLELAGYSAGIAAARVLEGAIVPDVEIDQMELFFNKDTAERFGITLDGLFGNAIFYQKELDVKLIHMIGIPAASTVLALSLLLSLLLFCSTCCVCRQKSKENWILNVSESISCLSLDDPLLVELPETRLGRSRVGKKFQKLIQRLVEWKPYLPQTLLMEIDEEANVFELGSEDTEVLQRSMSTPPEPDNGEEARTEHLTEDFSITQYSPDYSPLGSQNNSTDSFGSLPRENDASKAAVRMRQFSAGSDHDQYESNSFDYDDSMRNRKLSNGSNGSGDEERRERQIHLVKRKLGVSIAIKRSSVMVCRLRNYIGLLKSRSINNILTVLNDYIDMMWKASTRTTGSLNTIDGEIMISSWNTVRVQTTTHAEKACDAALDLVSAFNDKTREWSSNGIFKGNLGLEVSILTGNYFVGNMGNSGIKVFNIIGEAKRKAIDLCFLNRNHDSTILINDQCAAETKYSHNFMAVDIFHGRTIYELFSKINFNQQREEWLYEIEKINQLQNDFQSYNNSFEDYRTGKYESAAENLRKYLSSLRNRSVHQNMKPRGLQLMKKISNEGGVDLFKKAKKGNSVFNRLTDSTRYTGQHRISPDLETQKQKQKIHRTVSYDSRVFDRLTDSSKFTGSHKHKRGNPQKDSKTKVREAAPRPKGKSKSKPFSKKNGKKVNRIARIGFGFAKSNNLPW